MARVLVLGIAALALASACGQTARDRSQPSAAGGAPGFGAAGGAPGGASPLAGNAGSAGLGGSPGTSPLESAVTDCTQYCENLNYRLPGALCEDWNREGWEPEFCGMEFNIRSCPDYCRSVYETVSPACAATLPPVIHCVAPTYALPSPPSLDQCWLGECRHQLYTMTSACYGLREQLEAARATWEAAGLAEYRLLYSWGADTKAEVLVQAGGKLVVTPPEATAWTVPQLFDEVQRYLDGPGTAPQARYDAELGYPLSVVRLQSCSEPSEGVTGIEVTPLP